MKKEVQKKENEKTALSKKVSDTEKAKKDSEAKSKQAQETQKKQSGARL